MRTFIDTLKINKVQFRFSETLYFPVFTLFTMLRESFHLWAGSGFYSIWRISVALGSRPGVSSASGFRARPSQPWPISDLTFQHVRSCFPPRECGLQTAGGGCYQSHWYLSTSCEHYLHWNPQDFWKSNTINILILQMRKRIIWPQVPGSCPRSPSEQLEVHRDGDTLG